MQEITKEQYIREKLEKKIGELESRIYELEFVCLALQEENKKIINENECENA